MKFKVKVIKSNFKIELKKKTINIEEIDGADTDDYFDFALEKFTEDFHNYCDYGDDYFHIEISRGKEKRKASIDIEHCHNCGGHAEGYWED